VNGDAEQRVRLPTNRELVRVLTIIALFVLACWVVVTIRSALFDVFIAVFFAIVLEPLVRFLERRLRLRRSLAVLLALFLVLAAAVGAVLVVVAPFYSQLRDLIDALPSLSSELKQQDVVKQVNNDGDLTGTLHNAAAWLSENLPGITASVFGLAGSIFGAVFTAVTILFMTLFLSMEGNRIGHYAHGYVDPALQERILRVGAESSRLVASYVAGALAIALIAGTVQFIAMKIAGVPFAAGLAVLVALLDLIPMIGATIAGAVVVLVSLTVSTETAVAMLLVVIIYQQIENNIVQPLVQKRTISLSPFVIIVAVLIGSTLLGVAGALLALPVTASLKVIAEEFFLDESLLEDGRADEAPAPSQ
jgi:predicted PurR-regulated permease PerM